MKIQILSSFDMLFYVLFFYFYFYFFFVVVVVIVFLRKIATIVTFTYGLVMFVTDWYLRIKRYK